jgi:DNA-binding NtrC family response regulator
MRKMLLLVEDDPEVRRLLARELRRDFDVTSTDGLHAARRLLARGDIAYAAVVTDLQMETLTAGADLLEEAQSSSPHSARVLVSGSVTPELARKLQDSGVAHEIIRKPWGRGEVAAAVRRVLGRPSLV